MRKPVVKLFIGLSVVAAGVLGLAVGSGYTSDRRFDGNIEFRNRHRDALWVSEVSGFERPVACGHLASNGSAGLGLWPTSYPIEATIKWRVGDGPERTETLKLDSLLHAQRDATLVFEYSQRGRWIVYFDPGSTDREARNTQ